MTESVDVNHELPPPDSLDQAHPTSFFIGKAVDEEKGGACEFNTFAAKLKHIDDIDQQLENEKLRAAEHVAEKDAELEALKAEV